MYSNTFDISTTLDLLLVSSALPPASSTLELPPLGSGERLHVRGGKTSGTKLSLGHALLARSLEDKRVLPGGSSKRELVESDNFSSGLQNPLPRLLGHVECTNLKTKHISYGCPPNFLISRTFWIK